MRFAMRVAASALMAVAATAQAQSSAQLYGLIDIGAGRLADAIRELESILAVAAHEYPEDHPIVVTTLQIHATVVEATSPSTTS